jgi:hypothetical protein
VGVKSTNGWQFFEKEAGGVKWYSIRSTPELIKRAEAKLVLGDHVKELSSDDEAVESPAVGADDKHRTVFICYAKADQHHADKLFRALMKAGFDPWMDARMLVLGDDWQQEIRKAVERADVFVACLRPGFDEIGFRQQEVRWALDALAMRPKTGGFILPFILEPCAGLPHWCKGIHAGDHEHHASSIVDLIAALQKHATE